MRDNDNVVLIFSDINQKQHEAFVHDLSLDFSLNVHHVIQRETRYREDRNMRRIAMAHDLSVILPGVSKDDIKDLSRSNPDPLRQACLTCLGWYPGVSDWTPAMKQVASALGQ